MLTEKQIKSLKPGDPIVIHTTFELVDCDGDIFFKAPSFRSSANIDYIRPSYVSLPSDSQSTATAQLLRSRDGSTVNSQSKYDPTRPFKEGDRVRYCERDGRKLFRLQDGAIYEVKSNEGDAGTVEIWLWKEAVRYGSYPYNVFELVTPVEELEPYYIVENDIEFQVRMRYEDKDCLISVFRFKTIVEGYKQYYDMLPTMKQAREAAESECKRLKEEYRKEQNNG